MYLDQSGFAPTLPLGRAWMRQGTRKLVAYQAPENRRVNVVAAVSSRKDRLVFECRAGKSDGCYDAAAHVSFVRRLKRAELPLVVVLDNYSVHHSKVVKEQVPTLEAEGIRFVYLPPYSPELNDIEPLWKQVKYHDLPVRSYKTEAALKAAVVSTLQSRADTMKLTNACV